MPRMLGAEACVLAAALFLFAVQFKNLKSVSFTTAHRSVIILPGEDLVSMTRVLEDRWRAAGKEATLKPTKFRVEFADSASFDSARTTLLERLPKDKVSPPGSTSGL